MDYLVPGNSEEIDDWIFKSYEPHSGRVFSDESIEFLHAFGRRLLTSELGKTPAFAALGFWLRKSHLKQMRSENESWLKIAGLRPAGTVFHVCPSNVDTLFIYSLACSLLMGNRNILRISQRSDREVLNPLFNILNELIEGEQSELKEHLRIISYGHDERLNKLFSSLADVRLIWGGDDSVRYFKNLPTRLRVKDLCFPNRLSASLIDVASYLNEDEQKKESLAIAFFNDSYQFDQKACSSPQHVYLLADSSEAYENFLNDFFMRVNRLTQTSYDQDAASLSSLKLQQASLDAMEGHLLVLEKLSAKLWLCQTTPNALRESCGAGYFYHSRITELGELYNAFKPTPQTLTHHGFKAEHWEQLCDIRDACGVDRLVPIGQGLDFHYIWDGYHLLQELSSYSYTSQS